MSSLLPSSTSPPSPRLYTTMHEYDAECLPFMKRRRLNCQMTLHVSIDGPSSTATSTVGHCVSPDSAQEIRIPLALTTPTSSKKESFAASAIASSEHAPPAVPSPPAEAACNSCGRRARQLLITRSSMQLVICTRCRQTCCSICSRTCHGGNINAFKRPLFSLYSSNMSTHVPLHPQDDAARSLRRTKRRLSSETDSEDSPSPLIQCEGDATSNIVSPSSGCGEVFCRSCVVEIPTNLYTSCIGCHDKLH
ncbi:hypothetical protein PHLGIDRAFT_204935 [Phlebiopsis gigantea 11061_1 CR5-6]|uniref:Uncharacterized protein n=1 Tax=Phlebiopsis gigantea (strain 11061_1 CR5-6) TaxID=745531 RepID=A0A0C3S335_PHLG1|nr:hypothetical protein PHLGIDRAFT_204935 [Phlebiopsis gigantea 11061_1 CR5-6]